MQVFDITLEQLTDYKALAIVLQNMGTHRTIMAKQENNERCQKVVRLTREQHLTLKTADWQNIK